MLSIRLHFRRQRNLLTTARSNVENLRMKSCDESSTLDLAVVSRTV